MAHLMPPRRVHDARMSRSPESGPIPPRPRVPPLLWLSTPTPDGFERCMRVWVCLPMDDVTRHGTGARVQQTLLDATITTGVSRGGSEA
jgi:hypothetical protein